MPAISASGQVYVLNGAITVTAGSGGYVATGAPVLLADDFNALVGVTTKTYTLPAGVRGLILMGANGLANFTIQIKGVTTGYFYLSISGKGNGAIFCPIPSGLDGSVSVVLTNSDGVTRRTSIWWNFVVDDFGQISTSEGTIFRPPLGFGKYNQITNDRVPQRLGDDSQDPTTGQFVNPPAGSGVLVAAPGVGLSIVLWESLITATFNAAGGIFSVTLGGNTISCAAGGNGLTDTRVLVHGGRRLPTNTGIGYFSNAVGNVICDLCYTVEIT